MGYSTRPEEAAMSLRIVPLLVVSLLCSTAITNAGDAPGAPRKKLIEFGWDEPDQAFMRQHIADMEKTPFHGCVFHLSYPKPGGGTAQFLWDAWGKKAFTQEELKPALDDLKATPFHRFTDNFLRFNVTPGNVDWFDDFSAIVNNARVAAKVAREGQARGPLLDI